MAESVIGQEEIFASCGHTYQISSLVILYIDFKGVYKMRWAKKTVGSHQEERQRVLLHGEGAFTKFQLDPMCQFSLLFHLILKKSCSLHNDLFYLPTINHRLYIEPRRIPTQHGKLNDDQKRRKTCLGRWRPDRGLVSKRWTCSDL